VIVIHDYGELVFRVEQANSFFADELACAEERRFWDGAVVSISHDNAKAFIDAVALSCTREHHVRVDL